MTGHQIDLSVSWGIAGDTCPDERFFHDWVAAVVHHTGRNGALGIRIVGAEEGRELNRQYRGADKPTNVLSFPADLPEGVPVTLLGDLIICAPVVEQEASQQGKPSRHHWAHMIVHGILHLYGYDHEDAEDANLMEALERQILDAKGVPDPYD